MRPTALIADPKDPRHGTYPGYRAHLVAGVETCAACLRANSAYSKRCEYRRATGGPSPFVDSTGTRRRVQALAALGWSFVQIAERAGLHRTATPKAAHLDRPVRRETADAIQAAFRVMCMTKPPTDTPRQRVSVARMRRIASENGWVPPLAWDDIDNDEAPVQVEEDDMSAKERRDAERLDRLELMDADSRNVTYAAEALGITREGLNHWCRERGHMDLYWRLVKRDPEAGENQHLAA